MIPQETVDKIIETARVEEVVGDFVHLKKRGTSLIGLCPFHNEKTPSFNVSVTKGIYKCFGCGKGGDSVRFVMDHEKYSYPEALKYLAQK
jgi:DNA primase